MDFIYASHGTNIISTGGGGDKVHAHFGRGQIHCGSPKRPRLPQPSRAGPTTSSIGCKHISYKTLGF